MSSPVSQNLRTLNVIHLTFRNLCIWTWHLFSWCTSLIVDLFLFLIHLVLLIWDLFCAGFLRVCTDGLLRDGLWNQSAQVQTHSGTHLVFLCAGLTLLTHQRRALRAVPSALILHVRVRVQRTLLRTRGTHGVTWRTRTNIHLIQATTAPFI